MIEFSLDLVVVPKQADRSRVVNTKAGKQFVQHYQPAKVTKNAAALVLLAEPYVPMFPLKGPLMVYFRFRVPWLVKHNKAIRAVGWLPKETQPDLDNCEKQMGDVLEKAGFCHNDGQIASKISRKGFCDTGGVDVKIGTIEEWGAILSAADVDVLTEERSTADFP